MRPLDGKVAIVAGATRGAGRGIAVELGAAGATVYCTGRSTRGQPSDMNRPETIEETADLVTAAGGVGIPVRVDHTVESEVQALFERVGAEQGGRLDILVNDIWGGEKLIQWGKKFWELDVEQGLKLVERAVFTHLLTSRYGVPLMVARASGLVLEITDGGRVALPRQPRLRLYQGRGDALGPGNGEGFERYRRHRLSPHAGFFAVGGNARALRRA